MGAPARITRTYWEHLPQEYRIQRADGTCAILRYSSDQGTVLWPVEIVTGTYLVELGQVVATPGALDSPAIAQAIPRLLARHVQGDWGHLCSEDLAANDDAIRYGARVLSAYQVDGQKVWIITEADRSVTTVLLPEEY